MKKKIRTPPRPVKKVVRQRPQQKPQPVPVPQEGLEQMLMRLILNPSELKTQRTRLEQKPSPYGITSEKREGVFINAHGVQETIQEETQYVASFKDGTPAGDPKLTRCQTCGEIVSIDSLKRCPCGQTCCLIRGCGVYVERDDQWYCCKKHAIMKMLNLNLRFFS